MLLVARVPQTKGVQLSKLSKGGRASGCLLWMFVCISLVECAVSLVTLNTMSWNWILNDISRVTVVRLDLLVCVFQIAFILKGGCELKKQEIPLNLSNRYGHNFHGRFCHCDSSYDDESQGNTMIQCLVCEDWYHDCCTSQVIGSKKLNSLADNPRRL